jgi:L-alanine-DL-glutamate epimerase-like enolase superfamily enzyme
VCATSARKGSRPPRFPPWIALWDLKAKLLDLPLSRLLGQAHPEVPIYGSGGFTSYDDEQLRAQLAGWVERDGCRAVKMKIGSEPVPDPHRMEVARRAIGDRQLFIDANGAFSVSLRRGPPSADGIMG